MYHLNLFYNQQRIQREKDLDPVRLTLLGGLLILILLTAWAGVIYLGMAGLRADLNAKRTQLEKLDKELKGLGGLTDLSKIQSQAQALQDRMEHRTPLATQLDILSDVIPTNCQVRAFRTQRTVGISETVVKGRKMDVTIRKAMPTLQIVLEVETHGRSKLDVLDTRDHLLDVLRQSSRLGEWAVQNTAPDGSNAWNQVDLLSGSTPDPKGGGLAVGIFEIKIPMALKDAPKDL